MWPPVTGGDKPLPYNSTGEFQVKNLKGIDFFEDLPDREIVNLSNMAKIFSFPKDSFVIKKGDMTSSLYLITKGVLKVRRVREDGKEIILSILKQNDIFGEMAFLEHNPRSADVLTLSPSELVVIAKSDFEICMAENKMFMLKIIKTLVKRLYDADIMIERLALETVYGRLVHFLLEHAEKETETGKMVVKASMTQTQLASFIGASREMVSKIIKDLIEGGFLQKKGKDIYINKKLPTSW